MFVVVLFDFVVYYLLGLFCHRFVVVFLCLWWRVVSLCLFVCGALVACLFVCVLLLLWYVFSLFYVLLFAVAVWCRVCVWCWYVLLCYVFVCDCCCSCLFCW